MEGLQESKASWALCSAQRASCQSLKAEEILNHSRLKRENSPALEFRSWGQEGGGARPAGWVETPGCKLQGNWLMWYLVSSITVRWGQLGAVGGRGGLPKRKGRLRRGLRGRRLGGCRTGKGSELVQRKRERGCLALEGAAHGRRPEGFPCPSARAEALGKASKMPRLTLHKDLL